MTLWPAAATAWAWGMPVGRDSSPSLRQPAAMAPDETRMNSRSPELRRADLPHQALDEGLVEAVGRGQDRAPQLEDDPPGFTQVLLS